MNWEINQGTYFIDTPAGRYSVRRLAKYQPYGAFLNGVSIDIHPQRSLTRIKELVEERIATLRDRIASDHGEFVLRRNPGDGIAPDLYLTDARPGVDTWSSDIRQAKKMSARDATKMFETACRMFRNVEMILASALDPLPEMWLALWATPADAECINDDRDETAFTLATPMGVVMMSENIDGAKALALAEWIAECDEDADEDIVDDFKRAAWSETTESKPTERQFTLIAVDKNLLGVLVVRKATVHA